MGCRCRSNGETRISYRKFEGWHLEVIEVCVSVELIWFSRSRQWFVYRADHADVIVIRFFLRAIWLRPVSIIAPKIHGRYVTSGIDSVV